MKTSRASQQLRDSVRSRFWVSCLAIGPSLATLATPTVVPVLTRSLAVGLWILCLAPGYFYLSAPADRRRPLPFLPAISLLYGLYFILPLVLGVTNQYYNAPIDPSTDYEYPMQLVFFGWMAMMAGYVGVAIIWKRSPARMETEWQPRRIAKFALVLLYGSLLIVAVRTRVLGTPRLGGMFQFLVSLQWLGTGLLVVLARRGELRMDHKIALGIGILVLLSANLAGGSIAPIVMFFLVLGLAYWIGKPRLELPLVVGAVIVILFAATLRGVALDFRSRVWFGSAQLTQSEQAALMLKLANDRIKTDGLLGAIGEGLVTTAGRSADMDLFANVVRRTPSEVPYWAGETYISLIGSFIPRLLWPGKPTKELGQAFGHRYGYIYWTNKSTSINLPFLVEFFINFGMSGVIFGMLLVGAVYRVVDTFVNQSGQSPLVSMMGAVLLLPLLLLESDFSLTFGGLPLNAIALGVVVAGLKRVAATPSLRSGRLGPRTPVRPQTANVRTQIMEESS